MCEPATIALATTVASTALGTVNAYQQAQVSKDMANYNAKLAEINAQDAQRRGDEEAARIARQGRQLAGAQRAGFSARGIDVGEGTAADVLDQTDFFSIADQTTARNNARREAWGYRSQGEAYRRQADAISPGMAAAGSLLGGASSVADKWYRYYPTKP